MSEAVRAVEEVARRLPLDALEALSGAASGGVEGLRALRAEVGSSVLREACNRLIAVLSQAGDVATDSAFVAGALAMAAVAERRRQASSTEVVWTGPDTDQASGRLTLAVVTDLIALAQRELLLVSYAAHSDPHLAAALEAAAARGVTITLLLERTDDNPEFASRGGSPFPALRATRLAWPASQRTAGASLHAKVLVVDEEIALVGSANLTSRAMEDNLECGLLVRGHAAARTIRAHVEDLRARGVLEVVRG